ncbi:MAG: protein kinase, partial [Dehalococcoidia bacterium]
MVSERIQRRIDILLDEADQAIAESDWTVVRDRAQNVLALDPNNGDASTFIAAADRALAVETSPPAGAQPLNPTSIPAGHPAAPEQPSSFSSDRYQVQRFLGEGGKKKVYQARDTTLDREVAFALIKTEGLDDTSRMRIQREAQAMGRLGSHPHIVTVFDLGEEYGQPFMVTELMGGGDVEGLIENAPNHLLQLEQAVTITQEVCRGLEFAHSRGIVHRDLKPGNVWLTSDGVAKIGDFGLAVSLDRSQLTEEGMMVGTVSYMPPEQAMGGDVTPRSDLYSLGAMLYELTTGWPPFLGDD